MGFATGQSLRNTTRAKLACLLLFAIWGYSFWPTLYPMLNAYWSSGFDYQGLLVLPLVAILSKFNLRKNSRATLVYNSYGLLVLLFISCLWLFAAITKIQLLQQMATLAMLPAIVLTTSGFKILRAIFLPLLCLFMLIPYGENLFLHTQQLFASSLVKVLAYTNIPVYWEGGNINILAQEYQVASMIHALKYSTLFLTFGLAFAIFTEKTLIKGLLLASSFVLLPIILLFVTVYGLINISLWFKLQALTNFGCELLSYLVTAMGLVCAIIWCSLGTKKKNLPTHDGIDWRSDNLRLRSHWLLPTLLACSIILALPKIAIFITDQAKYSKSHKLPQNLATIKNWEGPQILPAKSDAKVSAKYQQQGRAVKLLVNHTTLNRALYAPIPEVGPTIKNKQFKLKINNHIIPVNETIATVNKQSNVIWSFNYVNGHLTTSPIKTQVLENLYTLTSKGVETGTISISTKTSPNLLEARASLEKFMTDLVAESPVWLQ